MEGPKFEISPTVSENMILVKYLPTFDFFFFFSTECFYINIDLFLLNNYVKYDWLF